MTAPDPPAVASVAPEAVEAAAFLDELIAERGLTNEVIRDAIAAAIPNRLFDSPVVGVGGARRQKVADCVMTVLAAALPHLRAQWMAEAQGYLLNEDPWLKTFPDSVGEQVADFLQWKFGGLMPDAKEAR